MVYDRFIAFCKHSTLVFIAILLMSQLVSASETSDLAEQREQFQLAKKALQNNNFDQFDQLKQGLEHYPLYGYLDYLFLRSQLNVITAPRVQQFLSDNQGSFYADRLRRVWLDKLAQQKKWHQFLLYYQSPQSASRQCLRLQALIKTGRFQQALADIPELWLVNHSQHKFCDPAFRYWQQQGYPSDDMRWQRIQLALNNKQFNLATYLAKPLGNKYDAQEWIARWKKLQQNPLATLTALPDSVDQQISQEFIKAGINLLARRSTAQAFDYWQTVNRSDRFSQHYKNELRAIIGKRAALNRQDRTLEFYGDLPNEEWRVRAALWQQNWVEVGKAIKSLTKEEQQEARWQYWLARSLSEQGQQQQANEQLQQLVNERDYYGFLAADRLGQQYQMNHNPIVTELSELASFVKRPDIIKLREFYALNMTTESRRQAYHLRQKLTPDELKLLALLTHQWGWHNQTIFFLGKARYWDDLSLRFPVLYDEQVREAGKQHQLDPSWLLGVARQESAFNPTARSHAGAMGLMQLMPKTGELTARLINKPIKSLSELLNPSRNIQLGSAYLKLMYDKNQNNPVLATASYNAGPHRVLRWLPESRLPADIWIENIPFNETRKYTRNVLTYAAIFDYQRNKDIINISDRMPTVQPKTP